MVFGEAHEKGAQSDYIHSRWGIYIRVVKIQENIEGLEPIFPRSYNLHTQNPLMSGDLAWP